MSIGASFRPLSLGGLAALLALVAAALGSASMDMARAQDPGDPPPIDAPATYKVDVIGISNQETSRFTISFALEGVDDDGRPVALNLENSTVIQPEPPVFYAEIRAEGALDLFDLAPGEAAPTTATVRLAYWRSGLYTHVAFPDSPQESCGKLTMGTTPALTQLDDRLPFPTDIFFVETLPPMTRILPDVGFGEGVAARYRSNEIDSPTIEQGQFEVHWLPEGKQLAYFSFEGRGEFRTRQTNLRGMLRYTYRLSPDRTPHSLELPGYCRSPNVYGIPIFQPSVEWIRRDLSGSYLTNQTINTLMRFHQAAFEAAGFKAVGEPQFEEWYGALSYLAPDGAWVQIRLVDVGDGTQVNISVQR
jgi:hypothetical protein